MPEILRRIIGSKKMPIFFYERIFSKEFTDPPAQGQGESFSPESGIERSGRYPASLREAHGSLASTSLAVRRIQDKNIFDFCFYNSGECTRCELFEVFPNIIRRISLAEPLPFKPIASHARPNV